MALTLNDLAALIEQLLEEISVPDDVPPDDRPAWLARQLARGIDSSGVTVVDRSTYEDLANELTAYRGTFTRLDNAVALARSRTT